MRTAVLLTEGWGRFKRDTSRVGSAVIPPPAAQMLTVPGRRLRRLQIGRPWVRYCLRTLRTAPGRGNVGLLPYLALLRSQFR